VSSERRRDFYYAHVSAEHVERSVASVCDRHRDRFGTADAQAGGERLSGGDRRQDPF
jgi:hypothetical protein